MPIDAAAKARFVAAAVVAKIVRTRRASEISGTLNGPHPTAETFVATLEGENVTVAGAYLHQGRFFAHIAGAEYAATTDWRPGQPIVFLREPGREYAIQIERREGGYHLSQGGMAGVVSVRDPKPPGLPD